MAERAQEAGATPGQVPVYSAATVYGVSYTYKVEEGEEFKGKLYGQLAELVVSTDVLSACAAVAELVRKHGRVVVTFTECKVVTESVWVRSLAEEVAHG